MEEHSENTYIAGQCNLGREEIRRRMNIGWLGVVFTFLVVLILEIFDSPKLYRIMVLPTIAVALSGFLQARHRFCYLYGWRGVFSIAGRKKFEKITDDADLKRDRRTAIQIVVMMLVGSILLTAVYMVI
jgi:hypothetical protein